MRLPYGDLNLQAIDALEEGLQFREGAHRKITWATAAVGIIDLHAQFRSFRKPIDKHRDVSE
jgi:hypothetical protein